MTSTFVSKAALIARRKLEQKSRPERREKKKIQVKEETKKVPEKPNKDQDVDKKVRPCIFLLKKWILITVCNNQV